MLAIGWGFIWDDVAVGRALSNERLGIYLILASITLGAALLAFGVFGTRRGKRLGPWPVVALAVVLAVPLSIVNWALSFSRHFTF